MGKYDNYSNAKNIAKVQKKLDTLTRKKNPNLFEIEMVQRELETAKLFESCQIFGREDFWKSEHNPNALIMFSDDNKVMMFIDRLVHYEDITSYEFVADHTTESETTTKKKGTITRALVGGAIAGGVGAIVGASSAGSKSHTTSYEVEDGFHLRIHLTDGTIYSYRIESSGMFSNKLSNLWLQLGHKLAMIIEENNK